MIKDVLELFNLKIDERFNIVGEQTKDKFFVNNEGIIMKQRNDNEPSGSKYSLLALIKNEFTIIKLPFTPSINQMYLYIYDNVILGKTFFNDFQDKINIFLNNCFNSEEDITNSLIEKFTNHIENNRVKWND